MISASLSILGLWGEILSETPLEVPPEGVGVFWGSVEDNNYVCASRLVFWGGVAFPFAKGCAV